GDTLSAKTRIRYRQPLQDSELYKVKGGLYVLFDENQTAITQGQFAAFYLGEELVGSGVIS
ncbi:MAG: aminomethyltransferase beta-barrel domain-containing protein, partial [Flavobacteriaceae bacterium]|nr:aminomethyltransferase beta-barrel domain-containing protein [Flavobacteriaceae bacterium]